MRIPGLSGDVVGTVDFQTLRNKTLIDPVAIVNGIPVAIGGASAGNVVGPASAVNDYLASFNGATGKLIKNSGKKASDFAPVNHTHSGPDVIIADLSNGKHYKVIFIDGNIQGEEV